MKKLTIEDFVTVINNPTSEAMELQVGEVIIQVYRGANGNCNIYLKTPVGYRQLTLGNG